jgi:hypothetical protein
MMGWQTCQIRLVLLLDGAELVLKQVHLVGQLGAKQKAGSRGHS